VRSRIELIGRMTSPRARWGLERYVLKPIVRGRLAGRSG